MMFLTFTNYSYQRGLSGIKKLAGSIKILDTTFEPQWREKAGPHYQQPYILTHCSFNITRVNINMLR